MGKRLLHRWMNACVICVWISAMILTGSSAANQPAPAFRGIGDPVVITPDQMTFSGPAITHANAAGTCTEAWIRELPAGGIILGADPGPCDTTGWAGATAAFDVMLPAIQNPTVYVMRISWPDTSGKGLHSPRQHRVATISMDGQTLWRKRTTEKSTNNDFYAAQHEPILLTIVVRETKTHAFTIQVPSSTAWDIGKIEFIPYPYPATIQGIGYSPYRDCQYPGGPAPTLAQMQEDIFMLAHTTNAIRTYSSTGPNRLVPAMAKAAGLKVFPGAWLDKLTTDDYEIRGLLNMVNQEHVAADGLIVGNEYFLRHRTTEDIDALLSQINRVKTGQTAAQKIPVMTAEIDNLMFQWESDASAKLIGFNGVYKKIIDAEDYVMVHIYPYWNGLTIEGAAKLAVDRYVAMRDFLNKNYPGQNKRLIIGETGWPSSGNTYLKAVPTVENQKRYMIEFMRLAEKNNVDYLYFDAFDEEWKVTAEGPVGSHWGYSYTDRSSKYNYNSVLVPTEMILSSTIYVPNVVKASFFNLDLSLLRDVVTRDQPAQPAAGADTELASADAPFWVYSDWKMGPSASPFTPSPTEDLEIDSCDRTDPFEGEMATRVKLLPNAATEWWSINWLYPEGNFGSIPEGKNFQGKYNKLTFRARGAAGGERVEFFVGGVGKQGDPYPDSARPSFSTGYVQLTPNWQTYTIDLRTADLSHVISGFGLSTTKCANPTGATLYLDDIRYEYDANMPPPPARGPVFPVYQDAGQPGNHYYPTNWMGDGETEGRISLSECWTQNPHSGATAIRIQYPPTSHIVGWAGIYWTHPAENWGDRPGGYDLTGVKRLTFWARSETSGVEVRFMLGGVGYGANCGQKLFPFADSVCPKIEVPFTLTNQWAKYTIDLTTLPRYYDRVVGGFGWVSDNPGTFYLDDIQYEYE